MNWGTIVENRQAMWTIGSLGVIFVGGFLLLGTQQRTWENIPITLGTVLGSSVESCICYGAYLSKPTFASRFIRLDYQGSPRALTNTALFLPLHGVFSPFWWPIITSLRSFLLTPHLFAPSPSARPPHRRPLPDRKWVRGPGYQPVTHGVRRGGLQAARRCPRRSAVMHSRSHMVPRRPPPRPLSSQATSGSLHHMARIPCRTRTRTRVLSVRFASTVSPAPPYTGIHVISFLVTFCFCLLYHSFPPHCHHRCGRCGTSNLHALCACTFFPRRNSLWLARLGADYQRGTHKGHTEMRCLWLHRLARTHMHSARMCHKRITYEPS